MVLAIYSFKYKAALHILGRGPLKGIFIFGGFW